MTTTVLLVDDDPRLLDAMAALVESDGFHVVKALDGVEALRLARAQRPAIVVTDYMMPVMDGGTLMLALASDPWLADLPVILNSAVAIPPATVAVAAFLRKPFPAARLPELMHQHARRALKADMSGKSRGRRARSGWGPPTLDAPVAASGRCFIGAFVLGWQTIFPHAGRHDEPMRLASDNGAPEMLPILKIWVGE